MNTILNPDICIKVSQLEICMILAGLYKVKANQTDDIYKEMVQKIIDKIVDVEVP
jgi:uncharacterized membrane protein (DUF485 family)